MPRHSCCDVRVMQLHDILLLRTSAILTEAISAGGIDSQLVYIINMFWFVLIYFDTFSIPTADTLFLLILSILTLESAHSIRFLYQHFLSGITEKSLNVLYYACSYAKVDYFRFMNTTVMIALKLIPDSLQTQPVFLCDSTCIKRTLRMRSRLSVWSTDARSK